MRRAICGIVQTNVMHVVKMHVYSYFWVTSNRIFSGVAMLSGALDKRSYCRPPPDWGGDQPDYPSCLCFMNMSYTS